MVIKKMNQKGGEGISNFIDGRFQSVRVLVVYPERSEDLRLVT
jgi:hypothetical protein